MRSPSKHSKPPSTARSSAGSKVAFLDRDGTVNIDHGYVHRAEDWEFTPSAEISLQRLQAAGFLLAIVTNQSGIATGRYSYSDVDTVHVHMETLLAALNVRIAAIAVCPHDASAACHCRKPFTGLANVVEQRVGAIDYQASWTIGDKISDIQFGRALGTKVALIRSRYWEETEACLDVDICAESLFDAVNQILTKFPENHLSL